MWIDALHIVALSAFAFAQPLYDVLGRNAEFFVAHESEPTDPLFLAFGFSVAIPIALIVAVAALSPFGRTLRASAVFLLEVALFALCVLPLLVWIADPPGAVAALVAAFLGVLFAAALRRWLALRRFLALLSLAALIFPAVFLFATPVSQILHTGELATSSHGVDSEIPGVLVVFDALPLASLLDPELRVDAQAYPNFARMAERSIWFPNATTVSNTTHLAVPALMTGRYPLEDLITIDRLHPENLFSWLGSSYTIAARELVTRLCPRSLCPYDPPPFAARIDELLTDSTVVLLHLLLPDDWRVSLPPILSQWQGFTIPVTEQTPTAMWTAFVRGRHVGMQRYEAKQGDRLKEANRDQLTSALDFASELDDLPPASFFYLHVYLPHGPHTLLPSGKHYADAITRAVHDVPLRNFGRTSMNQRLGVKHDPERGATWGDDPYLLALACKRHLLQVGTAGRVLGQIMDRLEQVGLFERALVIVTSDHGESYALDGTVREALDANTLSVPLFVKLPRQEAERIDDRNAELVDVVPTIAEVLGEELPWTIDGRSLLLEPASGHRTKQVYSPLGGTQTVEWPDDALAQALETINALVGPARTSEAVLRFGPRSELIGRPLSEFTRQGGTRSGDGVELHKLQTRIQQAASLAAFDPDAGFVPSYLTGQLGVAAEADARFDLAVAVNGVIRATARSYPGEDGKIGFAAMVPESSFRAGANRVAVFRVDDSGR